MIYPLVRDLAAEGIPIAVTCRVLSLTRQGYHEWVRDPISDRDLEEAYLIQAAYDAHREEPEYGYRLIADELHDAGFTASERRVWRLCSREGIWSTTSKKKTRYHTAKPAVHDDLLKRDFTAAEANEKWVIDITEHPTKEGKLYLCAIKDLYSNRIVGYSIDSRMTAQLAVDALNSAIRLRSPKNTIVHSDRGSQFRSRKFRKVLRNHDLRGSMGQVGTCADNAAIESFFALLQKNVLDQKKTWQTREELRVRMVYWIEAKYHRKRRQRRLGKLCPIEFEALTLSATAA
jgi:putative transposase